MKNRFNEIALSHYHALYGFSLSITGGSADAEDLVQETYLRAYRKFDQFEFGTSCKAWLFKIMRNIAIDQIRKKDPLLATGNETCNDDLAGIDTKADHLACAIDIKMAFRGLPANYKIVVLLKDIEGFTYVETHILDCQQCCDLFNEEKRFLSVIKNGCLQEKGPPVLKAKIEQKLCKKQRLFSRFFSNHPFKATFAAALAGILIFLLCGRLLDLGINRTPPFVRASFENHLKYLNGNLALEIESHDPRVVAAWFNKRIDFMPHLPLLKDDMIVLLGGRLAQFKGEQVALVSYRIDKSPVSMFIIRVNPTANVESRDFTLLDGRRFNFSHQHGLNAIAWTDDGNHFALISSHLSQDIMSCKVCHANGSGLSDLNALFGM